MIKYSKCKIGDLIRYTHSENIGIIVDKETTSDEIVIYVKWYRHDIRKWVDYTIDYGRTRGQLNLTAVHYSKQA